jgi:hypothetical protein
MWLSSGLARIGSSIMVDVIDLLAADAQQIEYRQCVVTYLDILGFRDLVENSAPTKIGIILEMLSEISKDKDNPVRDPSQFWTSFSDLVLRILPCPPPVDLLDFSSKLYWELKSIAGVQSSLARCGILVRGATTIGEMYNDEHRVFGPALIRAYELERKIAVYPRIVVDESLHKALTNSIGAAGERWAGLSSVLSRLAPSRVLSQGEDGVWFIDYLNVSIDAYRSVRGIATLLGVIESHKSVIENMMSASARVGPIPNHLSVKYDWLANYHNHTVNTLPDSDIEGMDTDRARLLVSRRKADAASLVAESRS